MRLVPPFIYDDSRLFYMHEMQTIVFSMTQVGNIRSFNLTSKKKERASNDLEDHISLFLLVHSSHNGV